MTDTLPLVWPESPRTRRTDPVTSHAAADLNDTAGSRVAVLRILGASSKPLADWEIIQTHRTFTLTPYSEARIRTARHELVENGSVELAGEGRNPAGNRTQTWRLR